MGLVLVTPPAAEPLSLAEAKDQLRVYHDADDAKLGWYIASARAWWENYTRRAMLQQTWLLTGRAFPGGSGLLKLGKGTIISVDAVSYRHPTTGAPTAFTDYVADLSVPHGRLEPAPGYTWPEVQNHPAGISVTFTAGYGAAAADAPPNALNCIRLLVAHQYENQVAVEVGTNATELPLGVRSFAYQDRLLDL